MFESGIMETVLCSNEQIECHPDTLSHVFTSSLRWYSTGLDELECLRPVCLRSRYIHGLRGYAEWHISENLPVQGFFLRNWTNLVLLLRQHGETLWHLKTRGGVTWRSSLSMLSNDSKIKNQNVGFESTRRSLFLRSWVRELAVQILHSFSPRQIRIKKEKSLLVQPVP
jgi:hypothetical protein